MAKVIALVSSGRYRQEHYEDVALIIADEMADHPDRPNRTPTLRVVAQQFADLFAADNPAYCTHCTYPEGTSDVCHTPNEEHDFEGGFDRERFLAACGLES